MAHAVSFPTAAYDVDRTPVGERARQPQVRLDVQVGHDALDVPARRHDAGPAQRRVAREEGDHLAVVQHGLVLVPWRPVEEGTDEARPGPRALDVRRQVEGHRSSIDQDVERTRS